MLRDQLLRLAALAERPHLTLQVLPFTAGAHGAQHGPFTFMEFPYDHDPGAVYIETRVRSHWREEPEEIAEYRRVFTELTQLAASPADSVASCAGLPRSCPHDAHP